MACLVAWIVKKGINARTSLDYAYVSFLLVMMASMFGGAVIYLLNPNVIGIVEAVAVNMVVMTVCILPVLKYWAEAEAKVANSMTVDGGEVPESKKDDDAELERSIRIGHAYVVYFVAFVASMIATGMIYIIDTGTMGLVAGVVVGAAIMTWGTIAILRYSSHKDQKRSVSQGNDEFVIHIPKSKIGEAVVILLILANEFLMGWVFVMLSGAPSISGSLSLLNYFSYVVSSYWFIFIMVLEMSLTIFMVWKDLPRSFSVVLALQAGVMLFSPTAINNQLWAGSSVYLSSALMVVLFIFMFEFLARNNSLNKAVADYYLKLLVVYAAMMAGLYVWKLYGNEILFAASLILEMVVYFGLVMNSHRIQASEKKSWPLDARWTFGVLIALFVSEFFMGALLDAQVNGPQNIIQESALVSLSGVSLSTVGAALYDFISFFGHVTASPWFLIMMGAEMGALVVFRIKTVRELETKIRLGMVLLAYAAYTVIAPSFLIPSAELPKIPFVGWSMGVGTAGPVAPALLVGLVGSYAVSGVLSFLFGSRQTCSVFCSAALMYQGTFYDSMKTFNRSSKIGRRYLTSRLSGLYKVTFALVWGSLIAAIGISYLDSIGKLNLFLFGNDPTTFLFTFYFGFLWYVVFFSIPFVGSYGCVSMGWCHWGTFNQLVSRLGFFKVKVKDPNICASCQTKDCAKACPVGLTDLPSQFISKGEFKSHKCIGVGNCVSSCPYENEYFFDVRNLLGKSSPQNKKKLETIIPSTSSLPMVGQNNFETPTTNSMADAKT